MASLEMDGPYRLDNATIDQVVSRTSAGNYALGNKNNEGTFPVHYIGRSDSDVNARLKTWVGNGKWGLFKFSYATSPKAAFEKECGNYHDFNPSGNDIHPQRPANSNWKCPRCKVFG